ncbi:start control protein cdc10 [Cordyceps militaris CM01]|uniref:Transcription factor SWI6 n=2 Tax=Cordyceps militaris TaxID=73501 RepID=G3JGK8_CORMM|nr:start control protein cdc10 [Cordyceps militaris CM01]ATY66423.1 start control cdc10 [Cordyceps militaris]EGX93277.1 start control protein cdc10 [Cordyceps militaris CM01]
MPSASQSSQQSFTMSQQSQQGRPNASFHGSFNVNPSGPQIYSASYSGVDVYEMEVNTIAVMRRRHDSCLNATQILKVAGVDKGKRTKILEKEIQTGEHEKVQGGYGKYQGTWINFERGVEVCRQYGVEELLRPLLTYDMGQDGGVAGQGDFNTPTKEQAMAAQRKRMYNSNAEGRPNGVNGTFFKNISSTASHAVAAISKARFDSPNPRSRNGPSHPPSFSRQPSMQNGDEFPGNSQQSFASEYSQHVDSTYSTQQTNGIPPMLEAEPPRKRQRVNMTPSDSFGGYGQSMEAYANAFPGSPTEPNESFMYPQSAMQDRSPIEETNGSQAPLPYEMSPDAESKRGLLMGLFMDSATPDSSKHDMLRTLTQSELDMPIDSQSHTALHWAATLSRMPLLRALITAGASPYRVNGSGETPLMRACVVTNSMDHTSFPDLLEVLGGTIEARDHKGRTVLHHIAVTSAVKGRNAASRYYLESLLEWVVRQGSVPNSQNTGVNGAAPNGSQVTIPKMGIARFMTEIVNAQDSCGDTALNIAARIGNKSIVSQLLEVGADPNIANRVGLRPVDFGIGVENAEEKQNGEPMSEKPSAPPGSSQKMRESSDDIIGSITHLLGETSSVFQQEMKTKQINLDSLHATLRNTSTQLGDARRKIDQLSASVTKQQLARQKVSNLAHAREDEQSRLLNEQARSVQPNPSSSWETELGAMLEAAEEHNAAGGFGAEGMLPSAAVLTARIRAIESRRDVTRKMVQALQGRSRDVEVKYRRVVALCTGVAEKDVDAVIDGLLKAVESEREELEIDRVRRFLGGVEGVVH